jgi:hypothetical protein
VTRAVALPPGIAPSAKPSSLQTQKSFTKQLNPYLNFDGNCAEAFRFYEEVLGGKIEMLQTQGESPMADQVPPGQEDLVMHARLVAGDAF